MTNDERIADLTRCVTVLEERLSALEKRLDGYVRENAPAIAAAWRHVPCGSDARRR